MPDAPPPPAPGPPQDDSDPNAAFLPIGIVFLVLGLSGLASDSMRGTSAAFLPVGIVFLVLSLRSATRGHDDGGAAPQEGPPAPDVTPR
jgi:hypothetical protein